MLSNFKSSNSLDFPFIFKFCFRDKTNINNSIQSTKFEERFSLGRELQIYNKN